VDPTQTSATGTEIFDPTTGAIQNPTLVGLGWPGPNNAAGLHARAATGTPMPGRYYAGAIDATDFPSPTQSLPPACSATITTPSYEAAVAGCVPEPIACGAGATINIDTAAVTGNARNLETVPAVECLIHDTGTNGDSDNIDFANSTTPPFEFIGGNKNPVSNAVGKDVLVSDSLVTVPVYNSTPGVAPVNPVTVIGFLQLFLNPTGAPLPMAGGGNQIPVKIVNMVGCGTSATGTPIIGNGASPVAVRLISP
jgi:hypothetical protein